MENQIKKPEISAKEFDRLRASFNEKRMEQFAKRKDMTWSQIHDFLNEDKDPHRSIDTVVDEEYHSSNYPNENDFIIV